MSENPQWLKLSGAVPRAVMLYLVGIHVREVVLVYEVAPQEVML